MRMLVKEAQQQLAQGGRQDSGPGLRRKTDDSKSFLKLSRSTLVERWTLVEAGRKLGCASLAASGLPIISLVV